MAVPGDIFGPPQPVDMTGIEEPAPTPWDWVPAEWLEAAAAEQVTPVAPAVPLEGPPPAPTDKLGAWHAGIPVQAVDDAFVEAMRQAPEPDAISGPLGGNEPPPELAPLPEGDDVYAGLPGIEQDPSVDDSARAIADLDPETYELVRGKQEAARADWIASRQLEEARKNREQLERNQQAHEQAVALAQKNSESVVAEAERLAQEKVDPGRWWGSRSTGQKIAAFASAIVGGLYQGRTGAANNMGMDAIQRAIDTDIDAQRADLSNRREMLGLRRGMVGEQFGRAGDAFHAAESVRIASWSNVIAQLEAEQQQFDPRGTTAMNIGTAIRDARARQAAAILKMTQEEREFRLKAAKEAAEADHKAAQLAETERNNRAQVKAQNYATSVTRKNAQERNTIDAGELIQKGALNEANIRKLDAEANKLANEGKTKEAEDLRKYGVGGDATVQLDANGAPTLDADGNPVVTYKPLEGVDGKPFIARSEAQAEKIANKVAVVEQVTDIIDEIDAIRSRVGGESSWGNSDDLQRLKVLQNRLVVLAKSGTEGMSSDEDMRKLAETLGASDVASFRARAAGLAEGRERAVSELNTYLKRNGAKPLTFKNKYATKAPETTVEDEQFKDLTKKPNVSYEDAERQARRIARESYEEKLGRKLTKGDLSQWREVNAEAARLAAEYKDISPKQREDLNNLATRARGTGAAADKARKELEDLTATGGTEAIRAEALGHLDSVNRSRSATPEAVE